VSLNLSDPKTPSPSTYYTAPAYNDAVNDAQFVRTFGIAALICSILTLLRPEIAIGVGMAVLGFGKTKYYRVLGLAVIILSIAGILLSPLRVVGSAALSIGIGWKGIDILGLLSREGKGDPDWQITRKRAIVGIVFSGVGLLVAVVWMSLVLLLIFRGR
jgi:hypothetical protein